MKFVTYNIQYCTGLDGKVDPQRIIDEVTGADVIALQEVERFWERSGNIDQVEIFREHFSDYFCVYGAGVDLHVEGSSPVDNMRRQFGNMILSKYPILHSRTHLLPKRGSIGPISIQRCAVEATISVNDDLLRIYSIHLTHLSPETRMPQIEWILDIHRDAIHEGYPVQGDLNGKDWGQNITDEMQVVANCALMFGDFNFQPDSEEYNAIVGPVSAYGDHITPHDGFVDAWTHCGGDKMASITCDVRGKPARLDYCFTSTAIRNKLVSCQVNEKAKGSDHLPVWVELDL